MAVYIVFDVETPNRANDRMSAIGITAIKDNRIAANYFSLVDPETHFDSFNTQLTGIDAEKIKGAPNFAQLWKMKGPELQFLFPPRKLRANTAESAITYQIEIVA